MTFGSGNVTLNISGVDGSAITRAQGRTSIDAHGMNNSVMDWAGGGVWPSTRGFSYSGFN